MEIKEIKELIEAAHEAAETEWEIEFMTGILERLDKFGESLHLSDKQKAVLQKMAKKTGEKA